MNDTSSPSAGSAGSNDAALDDTSFFGHPRGLRTLFFTEMWERFSYYGMRAILVLFMTASLSQGGLGFTPSKAGPIYALYTSMVFLSTVPGGWIADNFLGAQRAVFSGGILIMIGHVLLAMHGLPFFYSGLAFVVLGTGLLKPCISSIVGELYSKEDARRDAGFSIFYMGINIGAFTAPLVCGYLAESTHFSAVLEGWGMDPKNSWHWGFAAAAVGMFFGLVQYSLTSKNLGDAGRHPAPIRDEDDRRARKRTLNIGIAGIAAILAAAFAYQQTATPLKSPRWEYSTGTVYRLVGVSPDKEFPYAGGEPVEARDIRISIGADVLAAIQFGEGASGVVEDLDISAGGSTIRSIRWESESVPRYAIFGAGPSADDPTVYVADIAFDSFQKEVGAETAAAVQASIDAGARSGPLPGGDFKVGGLNEKVITGAYTVLMLVIILALFGKLLLGGGWTKSERARLVTIFVLFLGASVFWGVFEQAGSTLTLFAERNTQLSVFGYEFPASWFQSVNALAIVALAPVFAWMWVRLGSKAPSDPAKFAVGLLFAGLGFLVLAGGAMGSGGWLRVSPLWLFSVYLLHTVGELFLSPVGLSSMTKLAPARVASLMMGVWFLAASVGNFVSGTVSGFYEDLALPALFSYIALGAGVMAFVMFLLVGPIKRMLAQSE
ncbi:MAG: oligopeptide:H+ symporter [Planctomycetota bacterium]|nr:oligopeptide:H+ symporter [Planctomycetota bacterium]